MAKYTNVEKPFSDKFLLLGREVINYEQENPQKVRAIYNPIYCQMADSDTIKDSNDVSM